MSSTIAESREALVEKVTAIDYWGGRDLGAAKVTAGRIVDSLIADGDLVVSTDMDSVAYELWREDLRTGERRNTREQPMALPAMVERFRTIYQDEEDENARMERRQRRTRFFVVKATTHRQEVEAE